MKAVILIGGEATRLRPLTYNTPKAMVPVLNTPFLEHVISYLSQHQVTEIILAQSHRQQPIKGYFGDGSQFGVRLYHSVEDTPMGTGGAVKNAEKYLDDTFLVLNGDIFTDLDITAMIEFHRDRKAKVTIALTPVDDPTSYGLVETNAQGRITRFLEKPSPSEITNNMINAGIYILEADVLTHIPPQVNFSFERELFPLLLDRGEPVFAYPSSAYWIDMGTPEKYFQLNQDLLSGKSSRYTPPSERLIGEQSHIHPTAQINGPVVIGNNCTIGHQVKLTGPVAIGSGCTIQSEAVVDESIVWHKVQIDQRAVVKNSIIANNCHLYPDCCITGGSLLGDNVIVISGCQLKPASRIWPGTRVEADT
jgi:mannose-1-phosphate guanylyltransferase